MKIFKLNFLRRNRGWLNRPLAAWLAVCAIAAGACAGAQAARSIQLVANEWQPYTGSDVAQQGIAVQIVRTALQRAGYHVTVRFSNWPRALHSTYQGEADGVVAVYATTARSQRLLLSDKYLDSRIVVVAMDRGFVGVRKLSELRGVKVGIGRDYDYSDGFLNERGLLLRPVDHAMQNLLKLTRGRIDAAIEDRLIINYNIRRNIGKHPELGSIILSAGDLLVLPIHMGIHKHVEDAELIVQHFNTALRGMKQDGTLKRILGEWSIAP